MMRRPFPMPADGRLAPVVFVATGKVRLREGAMVRSKPFKLPNQKGAK